MTQFEVVQAIGLTLWKAATYETIVTTIQMTQKYSLLREERETAYQSINNGFIAAHLLFKTEAGKEIWIRSMQKVFFCCSCGCCCYCCCCCCCFSCWNFASAAFLNICVRQEGQQRKGDEHAWLSLISAGTAMPVRVNTSLWYLWGFREEQMQTKTYRDESDTKIFGPVFYNSLFFFLLQTTATDAESATA